MVPHHFDSHENFSEKRAQFDLAKQFKFDTSVFVEVGDLRCSLLWPNMFESVANYRIKLTRNVLNFHKVISSCWLTFCHTLRTAMFDTAQHAHKLLMYAGDAALCEGADED